MRTLLFLFCCLFGWLTCAQNYQVKDLAVSQWLQGSLYTPSPKQPQTPLVIIIAGSGPTDRNGNQPTMKTNAYKYLAEGLAQNGIAVYTFDKKFLTQLKTHQLDESQLTFDDMVSDVVSIVSFFRKQKQYGKIILAGHSEGSLVGILTAEKIRVDGFISIAGAGKPIDKILKNQIHERAPFLEEATDSILNKLKAGQSVDEVNPLLASLFRKSVQPFLISWMKYNPAEEIKKLNIPILILQGKKDLQVQPESAELLHQAAPKSQLVWLPKMNHVLKNIDDDSQNLTSYHNPELPVSPQLVQAIVDFVKKHN